MKPISIWTAERKAIVVEMWSRGCDSREIAERLNREMPADKTISRSAILGLRDRLALPKRDRHAQLRGVINAWTAEEEAALRRLFAAGMTHGAIGARIGKTINAVEKRCRKLGLRSGRRIYRPWRRTAPVNPIGPKPPPKNARLIAIMGAVERDRQRRGIKPMGKTIATFPARLCQYPVSEGRPWRFCERPSRDAGTSYCVEHHDLCFACYRSVAA